MFSTQKSRLILIILSFVFAVTVYFQLQPIKANAGSVNSDKLSAAETPSKIRSSSFDQSSTIGVITGKLSFPSERIPELTIFAIRIDNGFSTYYSIETPADQFSYAIEVDPGIYHVLAFRDDFAAGYTKYVTCGLGASCSDHSLLPVVVTAGDTIQDIDLSDWYAPAGTFPARPDGLSQPTTAAGCAAYHTIKWGETLYRVGLLYNLTWKPIAQANNLVDPNRIFAGQVLCIPSTTPPSTKPEPDSTVIPTFVITGVTRNKQVSIKTFNFPPHQDFRVTMGRFGSQGVAGIKAAETYSGTGGSITATYTIPPALRGLDSIAIRLESSSGYYSYNWFYNNTTH
ncbi:MAG: LysM peptidoglycan-binding domain-containing protein [Anaerolineales bacterium]|nr:LysM peptidoglycan-binding domain-containing protein [Anaerolineales bacterium]